MSLLVDDNEPNMLSDFHTETDLGKGRVPVGGQLRFLFIKSSLSPGKVVFFIITPITRINTIQYLFAIYDIYTWKKKN